MNTRDRMVQAIGRPLANMHGGCFKPYHKNDRGDCSDGNCYCARVVNHCVDAALDTLCSDSDREFNAKLAAAAIQDDPTLTLEQATKIIMDTL